MKIYHAPDAADNGGNTSSSPTDSHIRHMSNIPDKDASLLNVSQVVVSKWANNSFVTLLWKTQPDFANEVEAFGEILSGRNTEGGQRDQQGRDIINIDKQTEDAVPYVKSYIAEKFGPPDAKAHYAEFGLEHRHSAYELPRQRQRRKDALRMMVDAITANGFDAKQYGTAFWTDIKTRYDKAVGAATSGATDVSEDVGELVILRTTLRRVLHSILLILEANYPDTFDQAKRTWGFLKETY